MTHLHPSHEPRRLGRLARAVLMTALILGTLMTLISLTGAVVLIWQQVIA